MKFILNDNDKFQKIKICPPKNLAKISFIKGPIKRIHKNYKKCNILY